MIQTLITKPQLQKIHVLLNQMGLIEHKAELVHSFSKGRVTSTKELTMEEAGFFIRHLCNYDPLERMRNKVFALAYEVGIIWGDTPADKKMNFIKLNDFLKDRGTVKKEINKMTKSDLVKTVNQFQQILKHKDTGRSNKSIKTMLKSMNIETL